mmetsp:Transcript_45013/g.104199  ORF Transcript_45013/g.104199 Transcript_45013/m.104199 type:complete len:553 (-) Transcript_45013:164-1822(-)
MGCCQSDESAQAATTTREPPAEENPDAAGIKATGDPKAVELDEITADFDETNDTGGGDPDAKCCKFGCGRPVQPGKTRSGKPFDTCCRTCALNQGIGLHDHCCGGKKGANTTRLACKNGATCQNRTEAHLAELAHPLDEDYAGACANTPGVTPEPLTLKILFDWTDADGSGKLSRKELETSMVQIEKVFPGVLPAMTEESWKRLDDDGNGVVNFGEFASWAGPRLGLPLGMRKTVQRTSSSVMSCACNVLNCPCECFELPVGMDKLAHIGVGVGAAFGDVLKCKVCKHKKDMHVQRASDAEMPSPPYWDNQTAPFNARIEMFGASRDEFQSLVNQTYKSVATRDRKVHNPTCFKVPKSFQVVGVMRNENSESWTEYGSRRAQVMDKYSASSKADPLTKFDTKTNAAMAKIPNMASRLATDVNEWYLFHGTNPAAAKAIAESDFKVSRAGSNTGTLYGRGLYFAESITKADEYAKPDENGTYAVLLCRVLGGRVRYTDDAEPDPEELVNSCLEGPYDCVCGDREKLRGTYKEFVLFDSEDVYVEYIVHYKRVY